MHLTINTRKPPLGVAFDPVADINGYRVPLRWGENVLPAPPGVHHIKIYTPWIWRMGRAEITVDNSSGHAPPVFYALPYNGWQRGAIGFEPQKNPGLAGLLVYMGLVVALILACGIGLTGLDGS